MGFNLESMFREIEEILAREQKTAKTAKQVAACIAWWKKYAIECGAMKP